MHLECEEAYACGRYSLVVAAGEGGSGVSLPRAVTRRGGGARRTRRKASSSCTGLSHPRVESLISLCLRKKTTVDVGELTVFHGPRVIELVVAHDVKRAPPCLRIVVAELVLPESASLDLDQSRQYQTVIL